MKTRIYLLTYPLLALAFLALTACGNSGGTNPPPQAGTGTVVVTGINKDIIP